MARTSHGSLKAVLLLSSAALGLARHVLEAISSARQVDWESLMGDHIPSEGHHLDIVVAVAHPRADSIEPALRSVSDPRSPDYGKHWKLDEQMAEALGARDSARRVKSWLREETGGAVQVEQTFAGEFLRCQLSVAQAEQLFRVSLQPFRHKATGGVRFSLGAQQRFSVPDALARHIDFVSGLHLPRARRPRPSAHHHARRALMAKDGVQDGGYTEIAVVESRDRAFQVHVTVLVDQEMVDRICAGSAQTAAMGQPCSKFVKHFEAVATPVRAGHVESLHHVNLKGEVEEESCTSSSEGLPANHIQVTCVITLGPSLGLVNFYPTILKMRAVFADGGIGPWGSYPRLAFPALSMTVSDLRRIYNVPDGHRNRAANNSQAVASFFNISTSEEDARHFHLAMGTRRQLEVSFVGSRGEPGVEGNIDLQWIQAMGNNVATTYWATAGGNPAKAHEPFLQWILDLANSSNPPLVNSLSYGENEEDYSLAYQQRGNLELAKLGLRGVTVLVATGDTGVQGAAQEGGSPPRCAPFVPVWPASSPYVTAVGATMVSNHRSEVCNSDRVYAMGTNASMPFACPDFNVGEIVCSIEKGSMITGGGGFSNRFPRPYYQDEVVAEYLAQTDVNRSLFNASGRGYPDISAVGENIPIFFQQRLTMVGGTSSSSPIVAGLISLLNGERLTAGLPPLGFLNPLLYSTYEHKPDIVNDIRAGSIHGSNLLLPPSEVVDCAEGFRALPGWDAASGLGTPNFVQMLYGLVSKIDERWKQPGTATTGLAGLSFI